MNKSENKTPKWFWFFAIPFILLAISGLMQINSIFGDEMPEPIWAKTGYIIGIIGIFIGGVFLYFRKKWTILFLTISIIGFLTHRFWLFFISDIIDSLPSFAPVTLFLSIILNLIAIYILKRGIKGKWIT
jgi:hypothetical protein